ncbi:hypothetical protein MPLB_140057 [Mesorhizobium sp. ORS 3324]|nr:hypothetical protein MPLB_140057 [Mesorhizobium sp. ORS 3324]
MHEARRRGVLGRAFVITIVNHPFSPVIFRSRYTQYLTAGMCIHDTRRRLPGNKAARSDIVAVHKNAYIVLGQLAWRGERKWAKSAITSWSSARDSAVSNSPARWPARRCASP